MDTNPGPKYNYDVKIVTKLLVVGMHAIFLYESFRGEHSTCYFVSGQMEANNTAYIGDYTKDKLSLQQERIST